MHSRDISRDPIMDFIGIGIDIIEIDRIANSLKNDTFVKRIFTPKEQQYCNNKAERFAGRFAAKEACAKALGLGIGVNVHWVDFEILPNANGAPQVHLSKAFTVAHPNVHFKISITHCRAYAAVSAIAYHPSPS